MTSSTKPEVHYMSQRCQRKIELRPHTGNMHKKFGEVRPCGFRVMRVDRQTDILVTILRASPMGHSSKINAALNIYFVAKFWAKYSAGKWARYCANYFRFCMIGCNWRWPSFVRFGPFMRMDCGVWNRLDHELMVYPTPTLQYLYS